MTRLLKWGVLLLGVLPVTVVAEALPDPTRPPPEVSAPPMAEAGEAETGLQSVIIAPGRRAAIINGQTVELGEKYGDARLIEVNERGVVLRGPEGKQTLPLFPGVAIKRKVVQPVATGKPSVKKAGPAAVPREGK